MTKENENKLAKFLKANADKNNMAWINVLCYDQVDDKRLDVEMVYDKGEIFIGGDQGEMYEFSELEIIDERVLKF
jgi:hypothetical protein